MVKKKGEDMGCVWGGVTETTGRGGKEREREKRKRGRGRELGEWRRGRQGASIREREHARESRTDEGAITCRERERESHAGRER